MAKIKVYGELYNDTPEGIIADSRQIKYEDTTQGEFNEEIVSAIADEVEARQNADTVLYDTLDDFVRLTGLSQITSSEFISAIIDSEGKFLFGIRIDGSVEWGIGIPKPIREALERLSSDTIEELGTLREGIASARDELSQSIQEVEDKTVLALDIDPENGDVTLTYGSESPLTDAEIDPLTGDINFYYDL